MTDPKKIKKIMILIEEFGCIDGGHHKMWLIDQIARVVQGDNYKQWVIEYQKGEDGDNTYSWDEGIAP